MKIGKIPFFSNLPNLHLHIKLAKFRVQNYKREIN